MITLSPAIIPDEQAYVVYGISSGVFAHRRKNKNKQDFDPLAKATNLALYPDRRGLLKCIFHLFRWWRPKSMHLTPWMVTKIRIDSCNCLHLRLTLLAICLTCNRLHLLMVSLLKTFGTFRTILDIVLLLYDAWMEKTEGNNGKPFKNVRIDKKTTINEWQLQEKKLALRSWITESLNYTEVKAGWSRTIKWSHNHLVWQDFRKKERMRYFWGSLRLTGHTKSMNRWKWSDMLMTVDQKVNDVSPWHWGWCHTNAQVLGKRGWFYKR